MISYSAKTNIGKRKVNEDSFWVDEELGLYIVADGVGGLAKGEIASKMACDIICASIKQGTTLSEAVLEAHKKIIADTKVNEKRKGMASTVVVAKFTGNAYELAWVGDSRAYLWDGSLKQLTRDHSYVELLLETGHITYDQMKTHPDKNVISQALGIERKELKVATNKGTLEAGQTLMLSSDGLYEISQESQMIKQLKNMENIISLSKKLVNYAANSEGKDNITLLTVQSDANSKNKSDIVLPKIIREFDNDTAEIIPSNVVNRKDKPEKITREAINLDAEKSTKIREIKVKNVAPKVVPVDSKQSNVKVSVVEFLMLFLVIVAILVITTLKL